MVNIEDIKKILEAAVYAPSGENCQPWRFEVRDSRIDVFNLPERDQSLYNHGQMASYFAHGALIENICIASSAYGYGVELSLFPREKEKDLVATVFLTKNLLKSDPMHSYIKTRCTNRKPYQVMPLTADELCELAAVGKEYKNGRLILSQEQEKIEILARAASVNEQVMLSNQFLHNFFFAHVNWTQAEEEKKRTGFYVKTLELPPPAQIAFRIFRHWPIMGIFNHLGFPKLVAQGNAKISSACAAIGGVVVPGTTREDFITAGRVMQRVWLKATQLGLSIQPLAGALFLMQGIRAGGIDKLSSRQIRSIETAYADIEKTFGIRDEVSVMMFRIGKEGEPSARSSRLAPQISFTDGAE